DFRVVIQQASMPSIFSKADRVGGSVTVRELLSNTVISTTPGTDSSGPTLEFTYHGLSQGDGKLFQLQSPISADIRIPRDGYSNPVDRDASKPVTVNVTLKNTGTNTWTTTSHHIGVHVYAPDGTVIDQAVNVTGQNFAANVAPGQQVTNLLTIATGPGTSM